MPTVLRWASYRAFFIQMKETSPRMFTSGRETKKSRYGFMISPLR
jgi:hypothetical protein